MIELTESLKQFMWKFHREELPLLMFGHFEIMEKYNEEYINWLKTDEGKAYLKGDKNN